MDQFGQDCAIMGCDTSSMVIPSFYLTDGDSSPPAPRNHLPPQANGSPAQVSGASEIVPNLFLGDLQDARRFDGMIISVLPDPMEDEPTRTIRLPFLANGRASLDATAAVIDAALSRGLRVLVHCEEGCERAPLVIAW